MVKTAKNRNKEFVKQIREFNFKNEKRATEKV
jgi:hypothetical protein